MLNDSIVVIKVHAYNAISGGSSGCNRYLNSEDPMGFENYTCTRKRVNSSGRDCGHDYAAHYHYSTYQQAVLRVVKHVEKLIEELMDVKSLADG